MAQDMAAVTLDWTGLSQLGFSDDDTHIFDRAQTAFFQPLFSYGDPDAKALERVLHPVGLHSPAVRLIAHGVFPRQTPGSESTHLMTPLIHSLERLFAEKNTITAARHLKVCMFILKVYKALDDHHPDDHVDLNDCVCQAVEFHSENHNLNPSVEHSVIQEQCYKNHITPLEILLRNVKRRKCLSLDISALVESMLSLVCGEDRSLSTLYITINESKRQPEEANEQWQCPQCTLINDSDDSRCNACLGPKPREAFDFLDDCPSRAATFREKLMAECGKDAVEIGVALYNLKINFHRFSIGHVSLLLELGCAPLTLKIKDDLTRTICDVSKQDLIRGFDSKFSALQLVQEAKPDRFDDVYPLLVLHAEARGKLVRVLSTCELCQSTVMRHYFGLIGDFVYGESFPRDDVYDTKLRKGYCRQQLDNLGLKHGHAVGRSQRLKNGEFFRYWLSRYCLTDSAFLRQSGCSSDLKILCEQTPVLRPMLYQFEEEARDAEIYNSYYY